MNEKPTGYGKDKEAGAETAQDRTGDEAGTEEEVKQMGLRLLGRQAVIESLAPWPQFWFSHNCRGTFDYRYSLGLWFCGIWWGKDERRTMLTAPCEGMPVRDATALLARTTIAPYEDASFLLEVLYGKRKETLSLQEYERAEKIIFAAGQGGYSLSSLSCAILALQRRTERNKPGEEDGRP